MATTTYMNRKKNWTKHNRRLTEQGLMSGAETPGMMTIGNRWVWAGQKQSLLTAWGRTGKKRNKPNPMKTERKYKIHILKQKNKKHTLTVQIIIEL